MQGQIVISGSCRRCGAKVQATAANEPVFRCMARCPRCQYFTVLRDDPVDLPLIESLKPFFSERELDTIFSQSNDLTATCLSVLSECAVRALEFVEDDRPVVVAGLLHLVDRVEQQLKELFTDPQYNQLRSSGAGTDLATCQALYCALSEKQEIILPKQSISTSDIRASCFWVYAYPAFLRYAAHSAGGCWARILPQASEGIA